jgi:hypothetical protein
LRSGAWRRRVRFVGVLCIVSTCLLGGHYPYASGLGSQDAFTGCLPKAPKASRPPTTHIATAARQVWCWDMTYLPAAVIGRWFHLYLILDLYSRKIVGWEVHATDDSHHAAHLVQRTALAEGIATLASKPVLHGDNGSTLKATTVLAGGNLHPELTLNFSPKRRSPRRSHCVSPGQWLHPSCGLPHKHLLVEGVATTG